MSRLAAVAATALAAAWGEPGPGVLTRVFRQ